MTSLLKIILPFIISLFFILQLSSIALLKNANFQIKERYILFKIRTMSKALNSIVLEIAS